MAKEAMIDSGDTRLKTPRTKVAQGDKDTILERHSAQVNGHDLAKCEGWEGPLTPEERRNGADRWYVFYACEDCGTEATLPPHRWETIPCEPEGQR
ncbi:hypothetical protein AArcCO_1390 [Halalkaliarchaeum sp. AArc-CO]|nr:hypothetical protein AArcCO_1390 [Halalkaliarchaeum sp. AArc-CO]